MPQVIWEGGAQVSRLSCGAAHPGRLWKRVPARRTREAGALGGCSSLQLPVGGVSRRLLPGAACSGSWWEKSGFL